MSIERAQGRALNEVAVPPKLLDATIRVRSSQLIGIPHEHLPEVIKAVRSAVKSVQGASSIEVKATDWMGVVKIGRTHLEDATPLTVGQEWSGYAAQIRACMEAIADSRKGLYELAVGGTAVGTGLNAPPGFSEKVAAQIAELTGKPFVTAPNKFMAQGSRDAMVRARGAGRAGRRPDEDRQRHALVGLRPALRPGRAEAAAERARQQHHAGQGQPDAVRGDRDDRHPGAGRQFGRGVRRQPG